MATVYIPTPLRKLTGGQRQVPVQAGTVEEAIERVEADYPGFRARVLDQAGAVKQFVNVFVNGVDIRERQGLGTPVRDEDQVSVISAMAGGAR